VIKGGLTKGIEGFDKGGLDYGSGRKCGGTYGGKAGGEACEVDRIYLLAVISSCRSLARNWAGVIRHIIGGGDKGDLEDEGIEDKGSKGDGGGNG